MTKNALSCWTGHVTKGSPRPPRPAAPGGGRHVRESTICAGSLRLPAYSGPDQTILLARAT